MDGTATINAKVDSLRLCGFVQNLGCAKPRLLGYAARFWRKGQAQLRHAREHPQHRQI